MENKMKKKRKKKTKRKIRKKIKEKIRKIKLKKRKIHLVGKEKKKKAPSLRKEVKIKFRPLIKAYGSFREKRTIIRLIEEQKRLIAKEKELK